MDAKRAEAKLNRQAAVEEAGAKKAAAEAKTQQAEQQAAPKQQSNLRTVRHGQDHSGIV